MTDKATIEAAQTALIQARVSLLHTNPFYAHLLLRMPLEWMDEVGGGLSATDGESIFINPVAFLSLTKKQRVTDLVHEVFHCAAGHLFRRGDRDADRWNLAGDIVLDNSLAADGFDMSGKWERARVDGLAAMGLSHRQFRGMFVETVYDQLPPSSGGGCGHGGESTGGRCFTEPEQGKEQAMAAVCGDRP